MKTVSITKRSHKRPLGLYKPKNVYKSVISFFLLIPRYQQFLQEYPAIYSVKKHSAGKS